MFEEARRSPDLASDFYSSAYGRRQEDLAKLMQQALDQGWMTSAQPASPLAELMLGLWQGFGFLITQITPRRATRPPRLVHMH